MSEELIHMLEQDIEICRATGNVLREERMIEIIRRLKALDKIVSISNTHKMLGGMTYIIDLLQKEGILEE